MSEKIGIKLTLSKNTVQKLSKASNRWGHTMDETVEYLIQTFLLDGEEE